MRVLVTKLQKVERVAFAPEGTHLFASGLHAGSLGYGDKDTGIDVFDLASGAEPVKRLYEARGVRWFAPMSGGLLATATESNRSHQLDAHLAILEWEPYRDWWQPDADPWQVWFPCAVSADARHAVAALDRPSSGGNATGDIVPDAGLAKWTLYAGRLRPSWEVDLGSDRRVLALAFAPNGRTFWSAERVGWQTGPRTRIEFVVRAADTGQPTRDDPVRYPNQNLTDLGLGSTFAVAHEGPLLFVYDLARLDKKPKKVSNPAKRKYFAGFAIHPSGKWLATAGLDGAVTLWNTENWKVARSWVWDAGQARSVCFSADGTLAAAGTSTGKIVVWDLDL